MFKTRAVYVYQTVARHRSDTTPGFKQLHLRCDFQKLQQRLKLVSVSRSRGKTEFNKVYNVYRSQGADI